MAANQSEAEEAFLNSVADMLKYESKEQPIEKWFNSLGYTIRVEIFVPKTGSGGKAVIKVAHGETKTIGSEKVAVDLRKLCRTILRDF